MFKVRKGGSEEIPLVQGKEHASLAKTFPDSNVIFHEGAGIGNMSDLTGALLASAQLLPFHSNTAFASLIECHFPPPRLWAVL